MTGLTTTLAALPGHIGADLGVTGWLPIEQDRVDAFAEATLDQQWIHVDPVRAATGPLRTTIAHGYLTLSLVSSFMFDFLSVTDAGTILNYGLDKVRFPSPVPVGSKVRGTGELVAVVPAGDGFQTTLRVVVERDGGDKPVAVADVLSRFLP